MGINDRDYARTPPTGDPRQSYGHPRRPSWLLGGSIVTTLIAVNVVIYVLAMISEPLQNLIYGLGAMQAEAVAHGQIWRLITAQYLHGGTGHLLFNMIALHFLGRPLERMWSPRRFFAIYTICGLFGNVFYTILGSQGWIGATTVAVGASGSIYGLLGIVAVLFPTATVYIYFLFPVRIRTAAIVLGLIAFFTVQSRGSNYGGEACHLAGLVFGVWWAARGDRWWSKTQWRFMPRRYSGTRPRSAVVSGKFKTRKAPKVSQEAIDRILKKVYDKGIHSLSESEKRTLQDASDEQRRHDRDADRATRL